MLHSIDVKICLFLSCKRTQIQAGMCCKIHRYVMYMYSGRKITASFVDRYKQTSGREGKAAMR
jgi:hypothetical protein